MSAISKRKVGTMCSARCLTIDCGKEFHDSTADKWAENHAQRTGHIVELQMGWLVKRVPK